MLGATSGSAVSPSVCGSASGTSVSNLGDINTPGSSSTPSELGEIEAATVVAPTTKEKGKEVAEDKPAENEKKTLVDLPVDVLKDIVKEVKYLSVAVLIIIIELLLTCYRRVL